MRYREIPLTIRIPENDADFIEILNSTHDRKAFNRALLKAQLADIVKEITADEDFMTRTDGPGGKDRSTRY